VASQVVESWMVALVDDRAGARGAGGFLDNGHQGSEVERSGTAKMTPKSLKERLEALDVRHSSPLSSTCSRCQIDAIAQALQEQADEIINRAANWEDPSPILSDELCEWADRLAPRKP